MCNEITTKFHEKHKFEMKFKTRSFFGQKALKSYEILFFGQCHCVTSRFPSEILLKINFWVQKDPKKKPN